MRRTRFFDQCRHSGPIVGVDDATNELGRKRRHLMDSIGINADLRLDLLNCGRPPIASLDLEQEGAAGPIITSEPPSSPTQESSHHDPNQALTRDHESLRGSVATLSIEALKNPLKTRCCFFFFKSDLKSEV